MNINNAFPSKWLKSGDIEGDDLVLTIARVEIETVGQGEDAEQKPIVYFDETEKGLVLNKTNADSIARLHGPETDAWTGKRIALFSTEVDFGGKQTLALRVRLKSPQPNKAAAAADPMAVWNRFVAEQKPSKAQIKTALGVDRVSTWIAAEPGRTVDAAISLIVSEMQGF